MFRNFRFFFKRNEIIIVSEKLFHVLKVTVKIYIFIHAPFRITCVLASVWKTLV